MSGQAELSEALERVVESHLLDLHVAIPAVVAVYDKDQQTVECTPLLSRLVDNADGKFSEETLPKLPPIPVCFPRSADFFVSFPLKKGDTGLIVFNEVSIDQWLGTEAAATDVQKSPGDARRHEMNAGVFIPGIYNRTRRLTEASDTEMRLGEDGGRQLRFPAGVAAEVKRDGSTAQFVALANLVADELALIKTQLEDHEHTYIPPVHPATATQTTANDANYTPGSVANVSLKAEEPP